MTGQSFKVSIPVHRDEIHAAVPVARREETLQPGESRGSPRDGRRAELDALLLQGVHLADPRLCSEVGGNRAAAGRRGAVGFVVSKRVGDFGAAGQLIVDGVEERVVGGVGGCGEEHGDELKFGGVSKRKCGVGRVVVIPGKVRGAGIPDLIIRGMLSGRDVHETTF